MSADRSPVASISSRQRSAVTNGRRLFVDGDGNSAWSRRFRDLVAQHEADLGDQLSAVQLSLVRRAATIEVELEHREGELSRGVPVDLDAYARAAGHLRRLLETLGIERRANTAVPSLREYLATKAANR
jgi:hypothetical protein